MKFSELADIVRRTVDHSTAERVLDAICHEAQGEQVYIPRSARKPEITPNDTVKDIRRKYGVSRSTAYSWVSAWKR